MAATLPTLQQPAQARKHEMRGPPLWREKLRASLERRAANWEQHRADQWTRALLTHTETQARLSGKQTAKRVVRNFRRVVGHETLKRVLSEQIERTPGYDPAHAATCIYLTVRLKPGLEHPEQDLTKLMRHGFVYLDTKATGIHAIVNVPAHRRAEVLLATIERDQIALHIHAIISNRAGIPLEIFQALARASVARLPFVADVHAVTIADDTRIARTVAYSMKRAVPILSGHYPAIFMSQLYGPAEWRAFAKALVLS